MRKTRGCTGKIRYCSEGAAQAALKRARSSRRTRKPKRLHHYLCVQCGFYHLGHSR